MNRIVRINVLLILICLCIDIYAQEASKATILIDKVIMSEKYIKLKSITNRSSDIIHVKLNGKKANITISPGENGQIDKLCTSVQVEVQGKEGFTLWAQSDTKAEWARLKYKEQLEYETEEQSKSIIEEKNNYKNSTSDKTDNYKKETIDYNIIIEAFKNHIEYHNYLSERAIQNTKNTIDEYIRHLDNEPNKTTYIEESNLNEYLKSAEDSINYYRKNIEKNAESFIKYYDKYEIKEQDLCNEEICNIIKAKLDIREEMISDLKKAMSDNKSISFDFTRINNKTLINISIIGAVLILIIIWFIIAQKRKRSIRRVNDSNISKEKDEPAIVVRRKTTSILKKQSLEDVIDNKEYLKIECSDFCNDSAVRRIYLKNTCIKDIYNMYADDLRNPNNPKEDGCMVLGRWVYDNEADEYYISLEYIVQPGDDAVFQEYELNFGGKIKLKVAEQLRKLRRDTNLQYDLTCWVHSHPGLGVFFSNSDSNVQMQLKHPTHPNFLTAIVIDILTPKQELGIFTFKHDSTINSRNDIKKMYSLEELHKWAVESYKSSFNPEECYNILNKAEKHSSECYGIELNNSSIIDLCTIITESIPGLAGCIYGYPYQSKNHIEYIVKSIQKPGSTTDNDLLGCLVIGTHCSIPSIRKVISNHAAKIKFILFYSTSDETLISIPMDDNNQPSMDDNYYSEETLENLKIWTRRKR